jgi:hypothetical protein
MVRKSKPCRSSCSASSCFLCSEACALRGLRAVIQAWLICACRAVLVWTGYRSRCLSLYTHFTVALRLISEIGSTLTKVMPYNVCCLNCARSSTGASKLLGTGLLSRGLQVRPVGLEPTGSMRRSGIARRVSTTDGAKLFLPCGRTRTCIIMYDDYCALVAQPDRAPAF